MTPGFIHRLRLRFNPNYLYPGRPCYIASNISVGVIHKTPSSEASWQVMDYSPLLKGSRVTYLGLVRDLHLSQEAPPNYLAFELVDPKTPDLIDPANPLAQPHHLSTGDLAVLHPSDSRALVPAPNV